MKITKVALLKLIETETNRLNEKADADSLKAISKHQEDRASYIAETMKAWEDFAEILGSTNTPEWEQVPEVLRGGGYRNTLRFWSGQKEPQRIEPDLSELKRMRALIEIVADEFISTSDLIRLGFKIQFLFRS